VAIRSEITRFGLFEVDLAQGVLMKQGRTIKLQEQPLRILAILLNNRGQTVTREQLRHALWTDDTFVDFDRSLNAAVAKLRQALGDSADNPRFIETQARRGYRFIAPLNVAVEPVPVITTAEAPHSRSATESVSDGIIISPPKGAYVPQFEEIGPETSSTNGEMPPLLPAPCQETGGASGRGSARVRSNAPTKVLVAALSILIVAVLGTWLYSWVQQQRKLLQLEAKSGVLMDTVSEDNWSGGSILRAIEYYRQILALNPKSRSAYSDLASGYLLSSDLFVSPREAMPKAELAATRANQLDGRLWRPHVSLGLIKLQFEWDWPGARHEFQRAMAMAPNEPLPHHLYGWYLISEGRLQQARAELEHAVALEPSNDFGYWELGLDYYFSGQQENGAEQSRRAIALQPKDYWPHMVLGWILEQQGKFDEAISEMTIATRLTDTPQAIAALAHAQASAGRHTQAQGLLRELAEMSKRRYVSPYDIATVYAANADTEQTVTFLEKAYDDRSGWLALWLRVDPKFDCVRGHQRFSALLERIGTTAPGR
jgi:DNA-binding winged helix-turn-helix (wHTH) protein/Flp pilus assembly protein TadD